jgi:hypothetical protein
MTVTIVVCKSVMTESVEVSGAGKNIYSFVRTFDLDITLVLNELEKSCNV